MLATRVPWPEPHGRRRGSIHSLGDRSFWSSTSSGHTGSRQKVDGSMSIKLPIEVGLPPSDSRDQGSPGEARRPSPVALMGSAKERTQASRSSSAFSAQLAGIFQYSLRGAELGSS